MSNSLWHVLCALGQEMSQTQAELSSILNRQFGSGIGHSLATVVNNRIMDTMAAALNGDTPRIRAIKDIAILSGDLERLPSQAVQYVLAAPEENSAPRTRIAIMELFGLLSSNGLVDAFVEKHLKVEPNSHIARTWFTFTLNLTSPMMSKLGVEDFITAEFHVNCNTGEFRVTKLTYKAEDIAMNDRDHSFPREKFNFDTAAIFEDTFFKVVEPWIPEDHAGMDYHRQFFDNPPAPGPSQQFEIYYGQPDEKGEYLKRYYELRYFSSDGLWHLYESFGREYYQATQSHDVVPERLIPWMVAGQLPHVEGETKFLVQYDTEEKNIVLIPGDPYVQHDPLADVLPQNGDSVSDGS